MSKDENEQRYPKPDDAKPKKPEKKDEKAEQVWIWCDPSHTTICLRERETEEQKLETTKGDKPVIRTVVIDKGLFIKIGKWNGDDNMGNFVPPNVKNQPEGMNFKSNLPKSYMLTPSQQQMVRDQVAKMNKNIEKWNKVKPDTAQKKLIKYDMFKFTKV